MASPRPRSPRRSRRTVLYESRREREFYRYWEPIRALSGSGPGPTTCNLFDEEAVKAHQPFSSPDPALTAFCQLAALRLETRRAMLFFFDSQNAYVLAEATRTLSLKDDSVYEDEDKLWLGHTIIPRGFTICEETVCKAPSGESPAADDDGNRNFIHIINDIQQDVQFCDRSYVTDGPRARFYAGVPITSPRGITIGALCCLDDRKREDGVGAKGIAFLHDMASTVMKHLEGVRARVNHERGTKMVAGLSAFIEGSSNLRDEDDNADTGESENEANSTPEPQPIIIPDLNRMKIDATPTHGSSDSVSISKDSTSTDSDASNTPPEASSPGTSWTRSVTTRRQAEDLRQQLVATNVHDSYQRAARLLREATEADGTLFLKPAMDSYGGLVDRMQSNGRHSSVSDSGTEITETESEGLREESDRNGVGDRMSTVLASSHTPGGYLESQRTSLSRDVPEKFLRTLLRRYRHGKIWSFNEEGDASSDDDPSDSPTSPPDPEGARRKPRMSKSDSGRLPAEKRTRIHDGKVIRKLFPGVRSLAIVGQWDHSRARWFSACIIWTYSPLRLFSFESEINYVSAFCDVLMAEVYRLEAQNSDKAKSDFISSISHELRTPLHGILGSVECLHEQQLDPFIADLTSQIDICGRTLVDIVDHLLEFAKINYYSKARVAVSESLISRKRSTASDTEANRPGMPPSLEPEVWLSEITEEVADTAVYSYCCAKDRQTILNRKVAVIIEVEKMKCRVPVGGWKRICINLIGNSLKHTSEGYIRVSLKRSPITGKRRQCKAILTVADTGKGMGRDFVENHLFKAFSQEDNLIEGTGLGMSLVARIVTALGGKIEVQSEKGVGTTVTVTIPIEIGRQGKPGMSSIAPSDGLSTSQPFTINVVTFGPQGTTSLAATAPVQAAHDLVLQSIQQSYVDCGQIVQQTVECLQPAADVHVILEADLLVYMKHQDSLAPEQAVPSKPTIVLCNSVQSARQFRSATLRRSVRFHYEFIAQPCGPRRLMKALQDCVNTTGDKPSPTTAGAETNPSHFEDGLTPMPFEPGDAQRSPSDEFAHSVDLTNLDLSPAVLSPKLSRNSEDHWVAIRRSFSTEMPAKSYFPLIQPASSGDSQPPLTEAEILSPLSVEPNPLSTKQEVTLLLVDDNQINLQLLVHYAKKQGHSRLIARDGQQAVDAYKESCLDPATKPDVILMDINMPVLDGLEATRLIRALEQQYGLKPSFVIALTGLGSAQAQQEAFSSGVDLFLTKPVRLKELTKLLDSVRQSGVLAK